MPRSVDSILRRYRTNTAIAFDGETLTYNDFDNGSLLLTNAFLDLTLQPGAVWGLLLSNRPEYTMVDIALARAGLAKDR